MASATDYLEGKIIDHLLGSGSWTKPTALYVALFITLPNEAGTGGTEVTGAGYARIQCGPGASFWSAPVAGNGISSNLGAVQFGGPTANWGTLTGFGLYDAVTAGNLLVFAALTPTVTVNNNDPAPVFLVGDLTITVA